MKEGIHPKYYQAKVICDGKVVMTVGSTVEEIHVDVWSGNHPFYTGQQKEVSVNGQVDKFNKRYNIKK